MIESHLALLISFLCGSIPFGLFVAKLWGVSDVRTVGSTNIGATNVIRAAGWKAGALTFLLDFLKGYLPMLLLECSDNNCGGANVWLGLAAVLGHCFTPWLKFKGGKGVATTFGMLLAISPWITLVSAVVFGITYAAMKVAALGSLFAMLTGLVAVIIFQDSSSQTAAMLITVLVVLYRHRTNWEQLLSAATLFTVISLLLPAALQAETDFRQKNFDAPEYKKVVALMPSIAEAINELGASEKLVAAPDYTRLSSTVRKHVKNIGPYNQLSAEAIYALHPDLVIASMDGNNPALIAQLDKLGLQVAVINTQSVDDILRSMNLIAALVGKKNSPELKTLEETLSANPHNKTTGQQHKPTVFLQVGWKPLVSIGKSSFLEELIIRSGGKNLFSELNDKYPHPSAEEVIKRNPDVILICPMTETGVDEKESLKFWNKFKSISAVKNKRIHVIPTDWLTKPGFALIKGMAELRKHLQ